eukprot:gene38913-48051_t
MGAAYGSPTRQAAKTMPKPRVRELSGPQFKIVI